MLRMVECCNCSTGVTNAAGTVVRMHQSVRRSQQRACPLSFIMEVEVGVSPSVHDRLVMEMCEITPNPRVDLHIRSGHLR